MKNILRKTTLIALVLGTLSANAKVTDKVSEDSTVVKFGFVREGSQIYIKDTYDYLLYKFEVKKAGQFIKAFDFSSLPSGNYKFEIHEDCTIQIKPFIINKGVVAFEKTSEYTFFKPVITPEEDKVTLTYLTLKNDPIEVKIFDNRDRLLYKEEVTNNNIKRVYNMSQLTDESVVFTIKSGDRRFVERIELKK